MEAIKSYTDIGQSKVLALFLPLKSADMYYDRGGLPSLIDKYVTHKSIKNDEYHHLIPCWSLAALLGVLPRIEGFKPVLDLEINYIQYPSDIGLSVTADNPVEACYELILKLHKLKKL